jgi:glycosyltransferase involved in cell wall biosynthesis
MEYEVTIGIPVYNVEKYIRKSLESALAQSFSSIEILVLDDCGTDASMDIVRDYQKNHPRGKDIHIVCQSQNGGLGRARNRIIESAQGKYLYHLDADDAIAPNTIQLLYENAVKYDADIVYGSYERIEEFYGQAKKKVYKYPFLCFLKEHEFADYVYSDYGFLQANTWNFLIRKEIYLKNNIRHKAVNYWEDFSTTIDLPTYITRAVLLPDITYFYYCRYGSLSNFGNHRHIEKSEIQKTLDAMAEVKENSSRVKSMPYFHKRMFKVMMTHFYMVCAILKNRKAISPSFTRSELRDIMKSPLSFWDIIKLKDWRIKNSVLWILGKLPPFISISMIIIMGKQRKLI